MKHQVFADRLSPKEAAAILGLTPGTLAVWRSTGKGPRYIKIGRQAWYRGKDVEAYIEKQARGGDL